MNKVANSKKIDQLMYRRVAVDGFFPEKEEIKKRLNSEKGLNFYYGVDPTSQYIHLGHTVQLWLLKGLHDLGHHITLLIGDFTARIGDPTGKDNTRKPLSLEDVQENMKNYLFQISKILPEGSFKVRYNSEWLKSMSLDSVMSLASHVTVQQLIIRDMFQERLKQEKPIGIHEFLYPLMQGYDSVALETDGEVGGHDQIFNMLVGRDLVRKYLNKDKIVLATKLLEDSATGKKMSKSEGEIIAILDSPSEIRRKILAMNDKMTRTIFELCTDVDMDLIAENEQRLSEREFKELLAGKLVELFHGEDKVKDIHEPQEGMVSGNLANTIKGFGFTSSVSEAKNLIVNRAVEVNGEVIEDWNYQLKAGDRFKVGKGKFGVISQ